MDSLPTNSVGYKSNLHKAQEKVMLEIKHGKQAYISGALTARNALSSSCHDLSLFQCKRVRGACKKIALKRIIMNRKHDLILTQETVVLEIRPGRCSSLALRINPFTM